MDVNKLSTGQKIAAVAGVLLFIDLWMSWYSVNLGGAEGAFAAAAGIDTSASAWQVFSYTDILLAITALVAVGAAVSVLTNTALPVNLWSVVGPLAGVMTLLVLYRIINQPGPNKLVNVEWGAYVGLVLVAGVAYGGWRAMSESPAGNPTTPAAAPPPPATPPAI
jgi:hypothetical protein